MNDKVTFYSSHCPRCKVLELKLQQQGIAYEECDDVQTMLDKGMVSAPGLEVNGVIMDFTQAIQWIKER